MSISIIDAVPNASMANADFHSNAPTKIPINGVASAGPNPQDPIIIPIPSPKCLRNHTIADGIRGIKIIACAMPINPPTYT